jgi:hypothetical protein
MKLEYYMIDGEKYPIGDFIHVGLAAQNPILVEVLVKHNGLREATVEVCVVGPSILTCPPVLAKKITHRLILHPSCNI